MKKRRESSLLLQEGLNRTASLRKVYFIDSVLFVPGVTVSRDDATCCKTPVPSSTAPREHMAGKVLIVVTSAIANWTRFQQDQVIQGICGFFGSTTGHGEAHHVWDPRRCHHRLHMRGLLVVFLKCKPRQISISLR